MTATFHKGLLIETCAVFPLVCFSFTAFLASPSHSPFTRRLRRLYLALFIVLGAVVHGLSFRFQQNRLITLSRAFTLGGACIIPILLIQLRTYDALEAPLLASPNQKFRWGIAALCCLCWGSLVAILGCAFWDGEILLALPLPIFAANFGLLAFTWHLSAQNAGDLAQFQKASDNAIATGTGSLSTRSTGLSPSSGNPNKPTESNTSIRAVKWMVFEAGLLFVVSLAALLKTKGFFWPGSLALQTAAAMECLLRSYASKVPLRFSCLPLSSRLLTRAKGTQASETPSHAEPPPPLASTDARVQEINEWAVQRGELAIDADTPGQIRLTWERGIHQTASKNHWSIGDERFEKINVLEYRQCSDDWEMFTQNIIEHLAPGGLVTFFLLQPPDFVDHGQNLKRQGFLVEERKLSFSQVEEAAHGLEESSTQNSELAGYV